MDEKKILFIAYLYPPVGGKGLPGVQRTVKFVRYLQEISPRVLTLKTERYPEFFPTDNRVPLPINQETVIRTGTIDIFRLLLKLKGAAGSFIRKGQSAALTNQQPPTTNRQPPTANHQPPAANRQPSLFTRLKDMVSDFFTFPDYAHPWIIPAIWQGRKAVKEENISVIFATGMPWSSLVAGWVIKTLTGAKLIADFRDPWVNNPFAADKGPLKKMAERYLEKKIVTSSDMVSLNTDELRKDFAQRYPSLDKDKFVTLVNGYDERDFKGIYAEKAGASGDGLLMTHAGFLYGLRDPKPILEAIGKMREQNPQAAEKIRFRQMGDTELDYDLPGFIAENAFQKNYEDLGPLPYSECLRNLSEADILVIIQQDTKTQIPSKIYEYIYMNKPILTIGQKDGALGKMILTYQFGEIFEPGDTEGLAAYLLRKLTEKEKNRALSVNYEHREQFDVRAITKRLESIIKQIVS